MKVSTAMGITQLLTWSIWGVGADHPYQGLVDIHATSHALTVPLTYIWWSFIKDDAEYRTSILLKKVR